MGPEWRLQTRLGVLKILEAIDDMAQDAPTSRPIGAESLEQIEVALRTLGDSQHCSWHTPRSSVAAL
jgi:hypothetical protein